MRHDRRDLHDQNLYSEEDLRVSGSHTGSSSIQSERHRLHAQYAYRILSATVAADIRIDRNHTLGGMACFHHYPNATNHEKGAENNGRKIRDIHGESQR